MKKILTAGSCILLLAVVFAYRTADNYFADIFKQIGVSDEEAKEYIFSNFRQGSLSIPYSKAIKSIAAGNRAEAVKEIGMYIKKYTSSPEYLSAYKSERESSKPQAPENSDEYVKKRIQEVKEEIVSTEEGIKKSSGDIKKLYEATLKMQKDQLRILQNPKDPMFAMYGGKTEEMQKEEQEEYQRALKDYEENFPSDPKVLIRKRLKEFLSLTADINFDAKLVNSYGRMKFADPALEQKSSQWKMCFRSGKETITAARAFAQQWLAELK